MDRFKLYAVLGVVNLLLFLLSLLLGFQDVAGIIGFLLFIVAVVYLLFTIEEPPVVSALKIVEVHKDYTSKQNNLNTVLATEFTVLSMCFGVLVVYFNLNLTAVVAFLWSTSIPLIYYTIRYFSRNLLLNNIVDYALLLYPSLDKVLCSAVIGRFIGANTLDKQILLNLCDDKDLGNLLADLYAEYINALPLTSGEIEAINDL